MKINKDFIKETGDLVVDSIRTKNLFDKNRLWNAWINTQGQLVESISNRASNYIDVHGMDYITISGSTSDAVIEAFYNSSKTFVSYAEVSSSSTTLQVPNNAYYLRVTVKPPALDTYQIEEGSVATTYKPYQELDNQEVYSTGETRIGTWIDGKPLYRKVISFTLQNSSVHQIQHNISNVDIIFIKDFFGWKSSTGISRPLDYAYNTDTNYVQVNKTTFKYLITNKQDPGDAIGYAILEYTKTTD